MRLSVDTISVEIPQGWLAQTLGNPYVFVLYSPIEENDDIQENGNLVIESLPRTYTVAEYFKVSQDLIKEYYTDYTKIENGENYHIFSGVLNNILVKQIQFVSIKDKTAYVFTFTSNPRNFDRYLPVFKDIYKTFTY